MFEEFCCTVHSEQEKRWSLGKFLKLLALIFIISGPEILDKFVG